MSALWAPSTAAPEPEAEPRSDSRPRLRAVPPAPARLARIPFILVLIGMFGLGMTGLLMLNTTLQNQAFEARTLDRRASELAYGQADLERQIDRQAAPQELARRASALGLRPNPYPAFLVLPQGKIIGKPVPVTGNEMPTLVVKTPAQLAAERVAAAQKKQAKALQKLADAKAKALQKLADAKAKALATQQKAAQQKAQKKAAEAAKKKAGQTRTGQKKLQNNQPAQHKKNVRGRG